MSTVIRKLAWSRLADPKIAMAVSATGLLLGMLVGATAPNVETSSVRLPLSRLLPSLAGHNAVAMGLLYASVVLACLGLSGMLWAHSQGWTPNPKRLLLVSAGIVAIMVCLSPVGSSDIGSYAAYGNIAAQGGNPYVATPLSWGNAPYIAAVGGAWKSQPSVYGPVATMFQSFSAWIGGPNVATTMWVLMILNGVIFIGVGFLLLKTSRDPVRATLFWTANPVLLQVLVSGGHNDTLVAAAAVIAIQIACRFRTVLGDCLVGVFLGLACGIKINAALVAIGLAWPLLYRREFLRLGRIALAGVSTLCLVYSVYGLTTLRPLADASRQVTLPSPWRLFQLAADGAGANPHVVSNIIAILWPIAMLAVAWVISRKISPDQPAEVVSPFALSFAWVITAPWVMAWYTALGWVTLTQVPRNRMTRWLAIVTVVLALWLSNGGHGGGNF